MPSIPKLTKRGQIFYVTWTEGVRSRRLSLGTKDSLEATARYAAFLAEGGPAVVPSAVLTVQDALTHYEVEHVEAGIAEPRRQRIIIGHLLAFFGETPVVDLGPLDFERYCKARSEGFHGKKATPSTHRRELGVLSAALRHEYKRKRLDLSQIPFIQRPPEGDPRERWLTREELSRFLETAKAWRSMIEDPARLSRMHRFVMLAYYTASRRGALEKLSWFRVDFEHQRIRLSEPGEKKTCKRRPTIPISPALLPTLKQAYDEKTGELVLDSSGSALPAFHKVARLAGLGDDVTPHTLRHTRAVHLAQAGIAIRDIADLLGDTVATTEKNYIHYCPDHLRSVLQADL